MATKVYYRTFPGGLDVSNWAGVLPYPRPAIGASGSGTGDGSSGLTTAAPTQASPGTLITIATLAGPLDFLMAEFVSQPLAAAVTIAGTVTFNLWGLESGMAVNAGLKVIVYRVDCTTGLATQIVSSARGTELGTAMAVQNWTATPTSTACNKGDLLFVQLRCVDTGGTMAAGSVSVDVDGSTAAADGDSWVQFTEALSFTTAAPSGTTLYPTSAAADGAFSGEDDLALAFARGAASTLASVTPGAGPVLSTRFTIGGLGVRWYTPPLNAVSLSGVVQANLRGYNSGGAADTNASMVVSLLKRTAAGVETTIGKAAWNWGGFIPASDVTGTGMPQTITFGIVDTSLSNGDRLALLAYIDDAAIGPIVNGAAIYSISFGGAAGGSPGDTFVILPQSVSVFVAAAQRPRSAVVLQAMQRAVSRCWGMLPQAVRRPRLWTPQEA